MIYDSKESVGLLSQRLLSLIRITMRRRGDRVDYFLVEPGVIIIPRDWEIAVASLPRRLWRENFSDGDFPPNKKYVVLGIGRGGTVIFAVC